MEGNARSIREILDDELNKRYMITNMKLFADEIFEKEEAIEWVRKLLGCDKTSDMGKRIEDMSSERLSHAIATYLLGIAIKEGMGLNFDFLPRLFSPGTIGDAFYFFWSVICLCHDLGVQYENCKSYDLDLMDRHEGRCDLLKIEYDMFELKVGDLRKYGISPGEEEEWILNTLNIAKNYDRRRRQTEEKEKKDALIDHGIAGALILYDVLMKQYYHALTETITSHSEDGYRDSIYSTTKQHNVGEIAVNTSQKRFIACSIIIACTVARHNMWIASEKEDIDIYKRYHLDMLCKNGRDASVDAEKKLEQMLFMLDYMDTIDPVKGIYTRRAEERCCLSASKRPTKEELIKRRNLLLDGVRIEFRDDYQSQYRWGLTLKFRGFVISLDRSREDDDKEIFSTYCKHIKGMDEWLKTKSPVFVIDEDYISSVTCYYPFLFREKRTWPGGITEHEIAALCLYEGCGGGKADKFYQCHNVYQTINLLMMKNLEGERVRICEEKQNPDGLYIIEWKKTLEVMTDIFTAQCKYMKYCEDKYKERLQYENLIGKNISFCILKPDCDMYRVDRHVNFKMMETLGGTFAFTSTSKSGYLEHIASFKKDILLLEIVVDARTPYVDYAEVLGEDYIYLKEQEVLFPPFLKLGDVKNLELSKEEKKNFCFDADKKISKYCIRFDGFKIQGGTEDEMELIERLDKNKKIAADILDKMRTERTITLVDIDIQDYCNWKTDFQALVRKCFYNIWETYSLAEV